MRDQSDVVGAVTVDEACEWQRYLIHYLVVLALYRIH